VKKNIIAGIATKIHSIRRSQFTGEQTSSAKTESVSRSLKEAKMNPCHIAIKHTNKQAIPLQTIRATEDMRRERRFIVLSILVESPAHNRFGQIFAQLLLFYLFSGFLKKNISVSNSPHNSQVADNFVFFWSS
jgi:hypothetical protein